MNALTLQILRSAFLLQLRILDRDHVTGLTPCVISTSPSSSSASISSSFHLFLPLGVAGRQTQRDQVKSSQVKYSFIDKRGNPPDTNASRFYRKVAEKDVFFFLQKRCRRAWCPQDSAARTAGCRNEYESRQCAAEIATYHKKCDQAGCFIIRSGQKPIEPLQTHAKYIATYTGTMVVSHYTDVHRPKLAD